MTVKVIIHNNGGTTIGFPLAFLNKSGPIIKYIDSATAAITYARRGVAKPALKQRFTSIAPGAAISMTAELSP